MITHTMKSNLPGTKAEDFFNFMCNAPQDIYANWLSEEHYEFHLTKKGNNAPVGNFFYFDQNIGKVLDPLIRLVYSKRFFTEMDAHQISTRPSRARPRPTT